MGATITLAGHPQRVRTAGPRQVAFEMVAGPANAAFTPRGMPVFSPVTYIVLCQQRMWDAGHMDTQDHSDVTVEGYIEPRMGDDGKLMIAVVATSLASRIVGVARRAQELLSASVHAEQVYEALCAQYGTDSQVVIEAQAALAAARDGLANYCSANRALLRSEVLPSRLRDRREMVPA